jgi:hypothetical protein
VIEAGQTSFFGNALVGWVLLSALYAMLVVGSPFKTETRKEALRFESRAQVRFKQLLGWFNPRTNVAVTDRDLLLITNPWMRTLLLFGAFDSPVVIPRAKVLAVRGGAWFFGFVPFVEVEYDDAGERAVVQLAVDNPERLLPMLANTRPVEDTSR